ncbi:MAG TPA: hypothetical protein VE152_08505, partial [Acidimicrobiales bacterium]|nr:hypothetical protein [Acidimicrobiales bacterium]
MTGLVTGLELVVIVALGVALWAVVAAGVGVATLTRRWRRPIVLQPGDRVPLRWRWSPELAAL